MKKKIAIVLLMFACSFLLYACKEEKTIEKHENLGEISNTKEIPDNLIIIDSKNTESSNNPVDKIEVNDGKNNSDKDVNKNESKPTSNQVPNNQGTVVIDNESNIPSKPVDTIEVVRDSSKVGFYENLIKDDKIKLEAYQNISLAIKNKQNKVVIPIINDTAHISEIYEYVKLDHPEYFYIPTRFKILTTKINNVVSAMELELNYDEDVWNLSNIDKYNDEIEYVAKNILSKAKSLDGDYNKVLYVYRYLTQNVDYEADSIDDYSLYGALINKRATCEGYSESLQYLLNSLDIEAITVVGTSKQQAHQWNMVKIDDFWYYFDATWDAPVNSDKYLPYNYFAITLDDIKKTHVLTHESVLPVSKNPKYNYYYYNDLILYSYDEKTLLNISKRSLTFNPGHISFRTENRDIYNTTINNLSEWVPKILDILNIKINNISYTLNNELNIIDIYLKEA